MPRWVDARVLTPLPLREAAAITAGAAAVPAVFYHRLLFSHGVYGALDLMFIQVPFRTFVRNALHAGQLPLWAPQVFMGAPFFANGESSLLDPFGFFFFLMAPARAVAWEMWLHAGLSILTMYLFARISLRLPAFAAFTAGLAFAVNGYALAHTGLVWAVLESPWLPLIFLGAERSMNGQLVWAWLLPPVFALTLLGGSPQEMYYAGLWLVLYLAVLVLLLPSWRRAVQAAIVLVAMLAGGFLLAAAQAIPIAQLVSLGGRGQGLSFKDATIGPLPAQWPWDLLLPDYFRHFYGENAAWIGAIGLVLVVAGTIWVLMRRGGPAAPPFFIAMAVGSFLLALGPQTPIYRIAFAIPGMSDFRLPVRWLYPFSFAVAVLVGIGADALMRALPSTGRSWRAPVALLAAVVVVLFILPATPPGHQLLVAWEFRRRLALGTLLAAGMVVALLVTFRVWLVPRAIAGWILPLGMVLELFAVSQFMELNHPGPPDFYRADYAIPTYVATHGSGRVLPVAGGGWPEAAQRLDGSTPLMVPVDSVTGYSSYWPTAWASTVQGMAFAVGDQRASVSDQAELWRLAGLRYVVASTGQQRVANDPALTPVLTDASYVLYQLKDPGTRVRVICGAQYEHDPAAVRAAVTGGGFQQDTLYIEGDGSSSPSSACGSATITNDRLDSVRIQANASGPAWVVLSDSWYPGWQATVDGRAATVRRADYFFRAVPIPAGSHDVVFRFIPGTVIVGSILTVLALIGWAGSLAWMIRWLRLRW